MFGADSAGLDPPGLSVALRPVAFGVSLQKETCYNQTPVQALPLQTGDVHIKESKQTCCFRMICGC